MRHHRLGRAALGASLAVAAATSLAAASAGHRAAASTAAVSQARQRVSSVFLITGDRLTVGTAGRSTAARRAAGVAPGLAVGYAAGTVSGGAPGAQLQALTMDGRTYVLPSDAVPVAA